MAERITIQSLVTEYAFDVNPDGVKKYKDYLISIGVSEKAARQASEKAAVQATQAQIAAIKKAEAATKRAADAKARAEEKGSERAPKAAEKAARAAERARERASKAAERAAARDVATSERAYAREVAAAERAAQRKASQTGRKSGGGKGDDIGADWTDSITNLAKGAFAFEAIKGAAVAAGQAVITLGTNVIETGVTFESLRARLKTVTGSGEAAGLAFTQIQDFAKTTPYQLEQATDAFVMLQNLGLDASSESMTAFGNIAAAQGKDILQFIEAVADASTGEFERLKEFGIKASKQGDIVRMTFRGTTTEVANDARAISGYLKGLGESTFGGAMADQMNTTKGALSNLEDTLSQFFDEIAQMGVLDMFKEIVQQLTESLGGNNGLAKVIADFLLIGLRAVRDLLAGMPSEDLIRFLRALVDAMMMLFDSLSAGESGIGTIIGVFYNFLIALLELYATVGNLINRLKEIKEQIPQLPGPLKLLVAAFMLFMEAITLVAEGLDWLLSLLDPLVESMTQLADQIPSLSEAFDSAAKWAIEFARANDLVSGSMDQMANAAALARGEIDKLKAANAKGMEGKTDAELQDLIQAGGDEGSKADAEVRKRIAKREQMEQTDDARAKSKKARDDALTGALDERIDKTDRKTLEAIKNDLTVSAKQREAAAKELTKRDKKGEKGGKERKATGLEAQVESQFKELSGNAEMRVSAQALQEGKAPDEAYALGREAAKQTEARLRKNFNDTGELPMGISRDIDQLAHSPAVEESIGRVPPPVISVVNNVTNVTVSGNQFDTNVEAHMKDGISVTELSKQTAEATMRMIRGEVGEAVANIMPQIRV